MIFPYVFVHNFNEMHFNFNIFFSLNFYSKYSASIFPSAASWGNWSNPATNIYPSHSMGHVTPSHVAPHLGSYPHYA